MIGATALLTRSAFLVSSIFSSSSFLLGIVDPQELRSSSTIRSESTIFSTPTLSLSENYDVSSEPKPTPCDNALLAQSSNKNNQQFQNGFYSSASSQIRAEISSLLDRDASLAGPLIRLAFHDATTYEKTIAGAGTFTEQKVKATGGPNGSIQYELDWSENRALSKPLALVKQVWIGMNNNNGNNVYDNDHSNQNNNKVLKCDRVISLADVIALAGSVAVEHAGGPNIPLRMGRPDSTQADPRKLQRPKQMSTDRSRVESTMPSAGFDSDGLRLYFGQQRLGLREDEWIALSGVHGLGRHVTLLGMPKSCLKNLTRDCLENAPQSVPFVTSSVDRFSNAYFQALLLWYNRQVKLGDVAFIPTDVNLVVDAGLRKYVQRFARDEPHFRRIFSRAYQKMVETTAVTPKRY